jgi:menaquinone-dependent protoporphyrinogen IX oxidase
MQPYQRYENCKNRNRQYQAKPMPQKSNRATNLPQRVSTNFTGQGRNFFIFSYNSPYYKTNVCIMKALVVYGTRWGGTVKVAQEIAETLTQHGYDVTVIDAKQAPPSIEPFSLVVVGSGVRADRWTKEAIQFIQRNVSQLRQKKSALFVSCQIADRKEGDPIKEKAKTKYLQQIAKDYDLQPIAFGLFGGFMDFHQSHGLIVDVMMKINRRKLEKGGLDQSKTLDTRNWTEIQAWARQVATLALNKK